VHVEDGRQDGASCAGHEDADLHLTDADRHTDPLFGDVKLVDRSGLNIVEDLSGSFEAGSYGNGGLAVASAISRAAASRMGTLMIRISPFSGRFGGI
jgi:hypothetical protein